MFELIGGIIIIYACIKIFGSIVVMTGATVMDYVHEQDHKREATLPREIFAHCKHWEGNRYALLSSEGKCQIHHTNVKKSASCKAFSDLNPYVKVAQW